MREYARQIDSFEVQGTDGKPLAWTKTTKNHWKISNAPAEGITVRYRVYCNELSVRTNFVDAEFGILAPAATMMTSHQLVGEEHTVQLRLPAVWKQSLTSLERPVGAAAHSYRAANFDELVDSLSLWATRKCIRFAWATSITTWSIKVATRTGTVKLRLPMWLRSSPSITRCGRRAV